MLSCDHHGIQAPKTIRIGAPARQALVCQTCQYPSDGQHRQRATGSAGHNGDGPASYRCIRTALTPSGGKRPPWLGDRIVDVTRLGAAGPELLTVNEMVSSGQAVPVRCSVCLAPSGLVTVTGQKTLLRT